MAVDMGDHMAPLSAHHTCAEESDFKRPHPPNIGGYGQPYGTAVCPPYMRRGERLQTSSSAKYWQRYLVG